MIKFLPGTIIGLTVLLTACNSQQTPPDNRSTDDGTTLAPVETKQPNTNYKPAFEGQTRIAGVKTQTPIDVKVLNSGLTKPWGITSLPDGRFLITEKGGTMRIASTTGELSEAITGLPQVNSKGQGGLL